MKKAALLLILSSAFIFTGRFAFAEEPNMDAPQGKDMRGGKMKGMMGGGMMHQASMVASSDGGVIVLTGGKLAKYDKDLNLVKEVEIKGGRDHDKEDKMKWKEMPQEAAPTFKPMNDTEVAAMLGEEPPPAEAPPAPEPAQNVPPEAPVAAPEEAPAQ
jgi:hypothetical protein